MHHYLNDSSCDILCLQETWHLDENINLFNTINTNYLYTAISGVDSRAKILSGRPKGGVSILYKKSLSNKIKHITSYNRCVCGIIINSLLIFHIYYYVSIYHVIIIVMCISIKNTQNALTTLNHCTIIQIVMLLFVVGITILILNV